MPWLLKAQPYDEALPGVRTLYFSDIGFASEPGDTPSNTYWDRRIEGPLDISRTLFTGNAAGGYTSATYGPLTLANLDGALDGIEDYDWDGRLIELSFTTKSRPVLADFAVVFSATALNIVPGGGATSAGGSDAFFTINIATIDALFDKPFRIGSFGGAGGIDGGPELTGRLYPVLLGTRRQITPVLIDAANNIYMVSQPGMAAILAARDKGNAFTAPGVDVASYAALVAASMVGLDYRTSLAAGLIRLTTKPAGKFTVDAQGVKVSGSFIYKLADLVSWIVTNATSFSSSDLDSTSFTAMLATCPQTHGYYFDGSKGESIRQLIDALTVSCGVAWGFNDLRKLFLTRYDGPSGSPDYSFDGRTVTGLVPQAVAPRLGRQVLQYREYATVLTGGTDVAGAVSDADRADFGQPWRQTAPAIDSTVQTASLLYADLTSPTTLDIGSEAATEAARRVTIYGAKRQAFEVTVPLTPGLTINQTVTLTDDRYGLSGGKNFAVIMAHADASQVPEKHVLTVLG